MTGFTHDSADLDYFTSIYDALNKRVYVVPFHFAYGNKAYVFDYNSQTVKLSFYKQFVINTASATPIFINSVKFSTDYWLYYYQVNYASTPDEIWFDEILQKENGDFYNKFETASNFISNLAPIALTDVSPNITTGTFTIGTPSGASNLNLIVSEPNASYFRSAPSYKNVFNATNYE